MYAHVHTLGDSIRFLRKVMVKSEGPDSEGPILCLSLKLSPSPIQLAFAVGLNYVEPSLMTWTRALLGLKSSKID
jgi:hypothetical protein